jgi:hypothetical protein
VVGAAAGKSSASQTTVVYAPPPSGSASLPCDPNVSDINGVTYYQCGSTWYTAAYGSSGVIYMPVSPPSGY